MAFVMRFVLLAAIYGLAQGLVACGVRHHQVGGLVCTMQASTTSAPGDLQNPRSPDELRSGIANFYDESSGVWEKVWGEHMHHGYYPEGVKKDHRVAQVDMVDEVLKWAGADASIPQDVLDVGCGIGGSTRHMARKYGCRGKGITLSPVQAARAQSLSDAQGLGELLSFQVADALDMPFPDNSFDLVWSMESGEHMPDKARFVSELARVVRPGGRIIIVAWCHRDLAPGEQGLSVKEEKLLRKINRAYYLPRWCSVADYVRMAEENGLTDIRRDDWTSKVKSFWPAVIRSAFRPRALIGLLRSGLVTIRGAIVMPLMIRGNKKGLIKFGLVTATKPLGREQTSRRGTATASAAMPSPAQTAPRGFADVPAPAAAIRGEAPPKGFVWADDAL